MGSIFSIDFLCPRKENQKGFCELCSHSKFYPHDCTCHKWYIKLTLSMVEQTYNIVYIGWSEIGHTVGNFVCVWVRFFFEKLQLFSIIKTSILVISNSHNEWNDFAHQIVSKNVCTNEKKTFFYDRDKASFLIIKRTSKVCFEPHGIYTKYLYYVFERSCTRLSILFVSWKINASVNIFKPLHGNWDTHTQTIYISYGIVYTVQWMCYKAYGKQGSVSAKPYGLPLFLRQVSMCVCVCERAMETIYSTIYTVWMWMRMVSEMFRRVHGPTTATITIKTATATAVAPTLTF